MTTQPSADITTKAEPEYRDFSRISAQITSNISHPTQERRLAIRECDWNRLKRKIDALPAVPLTLAVYYSILFGIGGSTAITLIPLYFTTGLPSWVVPAYVAAFIGSTIVAFALLLIERVYIKDRKTTADDIATDMNEIAAELCPPSQTPPKEL